MSLKIKTAGFLIVGLTALTLVVASSGVLSRAPAQRAEPVLLAPIKAPVAVEPPAGEAARDTADTPGWVEPPMVTEWGPGEAEAHDRERLKYRGISVQTSPKATGRDLATQKEIAALLMRLDFVPKHRADHYKWVATYRGKITGWDARIVDVTPVDEGNVVVIELYPFHTSGATVLNDFVQEKYLISDGQLHHLESRDDGRPKITTFN
jgi:hypothetical protein